MATVQIVALWLVVAPFVLTVSVEPFLDERRCRLRRGRGPADQVMGPGTVLDRRRHRAVAHRLRVCVRRCRVVNGVIAGMVLAMAWCNEIRRMAAGSRARVPKRRMHKEENVASMEATLPPVSKAEKGASPINRCGEMTRGPAVAACAFNRSLALRNGGLAWIQNWAGQCPRSLRLS